MSCAVDQVGQTPLTTSLKRGAGCFKKAKYKVTVEKPGYVKEEVMLEGTPGEWYLATAKPSTSQ